MAGRSSPRGQEWWSRWQTTRLLTTIQVAAYAFDSLLAHAPTARARSAKLRNWWAETNSILEARGQQRPLYICIDANAKVGPGVYP